MKNLKDLVVVITGASSGIGLECARLFAAAGAKVALMARSADRLAAAEKAVAGSIAMAADVTDEAAVQKAFAEAEKRLGRVDDLASASLDDFGKIFETNMTGVFLCARAALPAMKQRKSGHIINISSIVGKVANPNAPLYCASKHALNGYTSGLQQQVAKDNIRVSMVSPSAVDTAYWGDRSVDRTKFLKPEEVAGVILFVASQPEGVLIKDIDLTALR